MSTPLQWDALQLALVTWLGGTTDPAARVIWAHQNGPRPAYPYFELALGPQVGLSLGGGELIQRLDLGRPAGQEMEIERRQWSEATLSVQCFTGAVVVGQNAAVPLLRRAILRLGLGEVIRPLMTAGLGPFDWGAVRNLTQDFGSGFAGQAQADVRCYVVESVSEFVGYFRTAHAAATYGAADPVDVELSLEVP